MLASDQLECTPLCAKQTLAQFEVMWAFLHCVSYNFPDDITAMACTCLLIMQSTQFMTLIIQQFTGLTRELPLNVHLLTLQFLGSGKYLLRLEHQLEMNETPWNEPVTLSLSVSLNQRDHLCIYTYVIPRAYHSITPW